MDPHLFFFGAEVLKIAICLSVLARRRLSSGPAAACLWKGPWHTLAFALPAGVYLTMNCSTVYVNSILSPTTFQLTVNVKIMTTAVAGWLVLSRPLPPMRWAALVLLTLSTVLGQAFGRPTSETALVGEASIWGFLVVLGPCAGLSALGAVLTEKLLKSKASEDLSIYATNVHMSCHTLLLNGFVVAAKGVFEVDGKGLPEVHWPPARLMWLVALATVNEAINGLLLSAIMRQADSNVKNYAFSVSVFVVVGFSSVVFGYWPGPLFFVGAGLVILSMVLYTSCPAEPSTKKNA